MQIKFLWIFFNDMFDHIYKQLSLTLINQIKYRKKLEGVHKKNKIPVFNGKCHLCNMITVNNATEIKTNNTCFRYQKKTENLYTSF